MSNNEYQDYLDEIKKSDNVAMAAALSKATMSEEPTLQEVGKEVCIYVISREKRGELRYVKI